MADVPRNVRITDARALKALAHPARNRILGHLQVHGPATATECAEVAGMSPSACSYHLRLLERYGFVEEGYDETRSDGRERLWKAAVRGWTAEPGEDMDPAEAQAVDMALARVLLDSSDEKVLAWTDGQAAQPKEWRDASLISNSTVVVTAEELAEVSRELQRVLTPYFIGERPDQPDDARLVHVAIRLAPHTS
jgi:DNA-binding transcriptional ArsR family regulator